ncbi:hypothetical protein BW897_08850 [Bacillus cereus]|uniref:Uncharacterized protein n=1 Tax=Bacillus cereus TaxID=1396 RepID=A0A1S9TT99_BACCE|nr:hypothetical protein BW897_08850 [Bacillus cereus]OOR57094.1 hypothetical protein BLX04_27095 [Bacillus mycoides]
MGAKAKAKASGTISAIINKQEKHGKLMSCFSCLSRYLWAVKLPPQNLAGAKKLCGSRAARKRPIGEG